MNYTVLRLLLFVTATLAAFTERTCTSTGECVVPKGNTYCYEPGRYVENRTTACRVGETNTINAMANHIASSSSIGYFNTFTGARMGDSSYVVTRARYVCMSGQLADGSYQSVCSYAAQDNSIELDYCVLNIGQPYVNDGCYTADTSAAAVQMARSGSSSIAPWVTSDILPTAGTSSGNDALRLSPSYTFLLIPLLGLLF